MKAFLHRLHLGGKEKDRDSVPKDKFPPLPTWPPPAVVSKPLPEPDAASSSESSQPDSAGRSSGTKIVQEVQKKVAFISPAPTPAPVIVDHPPVDEPPPPAPPAPAVPLKTTVSRFQAQYGKEPRSSLASSSKTDVAKPKTTSTRTASPYLQKTYESPSANSLRSGTPYSSMSAQSSGSRILAATSWSEVTEDDLVCNLGARERTRQEVLFEIISSEDRYVSELAKMKDTFIDPMLHPYSTTVASTASTPNLDYDYYRAESPFESTDDLPPIAARFMSPTPSLQPPARSTTHLESLETEDDDDEPTELYSKPHSPYRVTATRSGGRSGSTSVPFPSRSHQSLPPPPRNASTQSLGRQSVMAERDRKTSQTQNSGMLRKVRKSQTVSTGILGDAVAPHQLPEDLRICLEVIDSGVFDGHKRLCEALKKRYDDQFPLVRSLADVFVSNSDIFHGYATYVLHLERALDQVDAALSNTSTKKPKKQDASEWQRVCKYIQKLEENAADKGETGLAITLSKPFQRLLKYPLLFQNLLFHTDPSTFEYESTLQMVAEVETIVRSIEDEKIQKEERDKTRDVFARIEGLDKIKQLMLPKPSRVLLEERACTPAQGGAASPKPSSPTPPVSGTGAKNVRGKSSFKRLSDVLSSSNGVGGKKDLWFVVFNDVVLQCQRTGTTSLPLVASTNSRVNSLPELQGKAKYATTGRKNVSTRPRNLYKFIKIETWAIGDVLQPNEGVVSMDDVAKTRSQVFSAQPRIIPLPDDDDRDDGDSDDSDKKSKMSFSYWGADKVTVQKPLLKPRPGGVTARRGGITASYGRESSANAKFGSRLIADGSTHPRPSSASRRTGATTPTAPRRIANPPGGTSTGTSTGTGTTGVAASDEGPNYARATITRPAWDSTSTRTPVPGGPKRPRNSSAASSMTATRTPLLPPATPAALMNGPVAAAAKGPGVSSPAPSEDSGVGLYRQLLANDPSLQP